VNSLDFLKYMINEKNYLTSFLSLRFPAEKNRERNRNRITEEIREELGRKPTRFSLRHQGLF